MGQKLNNLWKHYDWAGAWLKPTSVGVVPLNMSKIPQNILDFAQKFNR